MFTNLKVAILLIVACALNACGAAWKEQVVHVAPCVENPKRPVVFHLKCAKQGTSGLSPEQWEKLCAGHLEEDNCPK